MIYQCSEIDRLRYAKNCFKIDADDFNTLQKGLKTSEKTNSILKSSARLRKRECERLKAKLNEIIVNVEYDSTETAEAGTPATSASTTSGTYGVKRRRSNIKETPTIIVELIDVGEPSKLCNLIYSFIEICIEFAH